MPSVGNQESFGSCLLIYWMTQWFFVKFNLLCVSLSSEFRPPQGGSSSSSTGRTTTTRSPPYYTTPRPLLTTSPGQRYRTITTVRQPILIPAIGSSSDTNQIPDTNQKSGRFPPVQVLPPALQPPALPPQEFCTPRVIADISWPRTQQGQTAKQPCPVGTLGIIPLYHYQSGLNHETCILANMLLLNIQALFNLKHICFST